jgi:RHS repeat-associated protein
MLETMSQALLIKTSSASYEMQFPNGSKKEFALSDGSVGTSRRIFMTQIIDPAGNSLQLNYDSQLRISNIVDAIGQDTSLLYTNTAYPFAITEVVDPFGRTADFQYDASGMLIQTTDVLGLSSQMIYGTNEFVTALVTPYGTNLFSTSVPANRGSGVTWLQATDPLGQTEFVQFDNGDFNQDIPPVAQLPHGIEFYEDQRSRHTRYWDKNAYAQGAGDITQATTYHWCIIQDQASASRLPESIKKPLEYRYWYNYPNQIISYTVQDASINKPAVTARVLDDGTTQLYYNQFNAFGNLTNAIDPVGRNFTYVYATNNIDLIEVRMTRNGKNELQASRTYNSQHQPLTVTDVAGQTTTKTYNARGQILTTTDPLGEITTFSYDTNGYLLSVMGPLQDTNDVTSFSYDSFGRQRTMTDTEGYTFTFDYDAMDRITQKTYPDGTYDQFVYNRLDLEAIKDRLGRWTTNTYNAIRQLASTQDPLGRVTQYEWCRCGAAKSLIDPMGRETTWTYDVQSRPVVKQFPDGSTITYTYENSTSRLMTRQDENGQHTVYEYYPDNNPKRASYPDSVVPTPAVTYTYDPDYNRALTMQDGVGETVYSYYPITPIPALGAGKLATVAGPLTNSAVAYQYDQLGRVVSRSINGVATLLTYDILGREAGETNVLGAFQHTYLGATLFVASDGYPNGQTNLYRYYNNLGDRHLEQLTHLKPDGTLLSSLGYAYDAVGEILLLTNSLDTSTGAIWALGYDAANQLTSATSMQNGATNQTFAYIYDLDANRLAEQIGTTTNLAAYNALNQMVAGSVMPTNAAYAWDAEHRLVAVTVSNCLTQFTYDGAGHCVGISQSVAGIQISNRLFVWCDNMLREEHTPAGAVAKRFFDHGVQIAIGAQAGNFYYTRDQLSSIREVTDGNGNIQARYSYDPYGRQTLLTGELNADFGFAGMYWCNEVGLNLAMYRTYDPTLGRWLSRDPLNSGELRQGPNLYAYAGNDPLNKLDPSGLACCDSDVTKLQIAAAAAVFTCGKVIWKFDPFSAGSCATALAALKYYGQAVRDCEDSCHGPAPCQFYWIFPPSTPNPPGCGF